MTPRAKICGVCSAADARAAVDAGADYVGVILAAGFRRTRTFADAAAIFASVPVRRVGVFVDPEDVLVREAAVRFGLHAVQLHGSETVEFVRSLRALLCDLDEPPLVWKAVRVRTTEQAAAELATWSRVADSILLDAWSASTRGGAGVSFDWDAVRSLVPRAGRSFDLVVAGGLTPQNVAGVVRILEPDIVDVSSGVEDEPGRKSVERMRAFIAAAKQTAARH